MLIWPLDYAYKTTVPVRKIGCSFTCHYMPVVCISMRDNYKWPVCPEHLIEYETHPQRPFSP